MTQQTTNISRRGFLTLGGLTALGGAAALAGCAPQTAADKLSGTGTERAPPIWTSRRSTT
ncbi:MAG: twin-arginine translocation signal domain-containing protein [Adlercreutzia sp.]